MAQSTSLNTQDEITWNWIIPNFKGLYDAAKSAKKARIVKEKFKIGGKNWAFELERYKEEDVGIFLDFDGPDWACAEYSGYLKSSEGEFIKTVNLGMNEYVPKNSNGWGRKKWKTLSALQNDGFLKDGTLTLKLIVEVYSRKSFLRMQASKDLQKWANSTVGFDVSFNFTEKEGSQNATGQIRAHRSFLSIRSSVFASMFGASATDGQVTITDMTEKSFRILLNFLYSGEVDSEWGSVAAELFYGAHKYKLGDLKEYLCANVEAVLTVENVMTLRNLAGFYNLPQVLEATVKFVEKNGKVFLENHDVIFKTLRK